MTQQTTVFNDKGPGCLVRALWFLFIGIPIGLPWTVIAWFFCITVIGLPLGLWMLNRLPQIVTLKSARTQTVVTTTPGGQTQVTHTGAPQPPFLLRAVYFLFIGWWFSLVWLIFAWLLALLTLGLGLPIAFWMFDRVPTITTLAR